MPRDREYSHWISIHFYRGQPWTITEEEELLRLYEKYAHIEDKNERYRKIAKPLHRGKTECWEKYKQLKPKKSPKKENPLFVVEDDEPVRTTIDRPPSRQMMIDILPPGPSQSLLHSRPIESPIDEKEFSAAAKVMERRKSSTHKNKLSYNSNASGSGGSNRDSPNDGSFFESVKKPSKYGNNNNNSGRSNMNRHRNQMMKEVIDVEDVEDFDDDDNDDNGDSKYDEDSMSRLNDSFSPTSSSKNNNSNNNGPFNISEYNTYDLDIDQEKLILKCILGNENRSSDLPESWREQGFYFNEKITYGLIQNNGGPCGVVGVVQAYIIKNLLYTNYSNSYNGYPKKLSVEEKDMILHGSFNKNVVIANSLADIFWKVSENNNNNMTELCLPHGYKKYKFSAILSNINYFTDPKGEGVRLFLYTIITSHGIKNIKFDCDSIITENSLIGNHNYANQELVNLILTGYATTNVFNGTKDIGDNTILKGINHVSEIGFLTLFEHYKYVECGSNYKEPIYPIWVICSESHYSVLFNSDGKYSAFRVGDSFDLYYYDQLMKADEEYRLTVKIVDDLSKCEKGECDGKSCHCLIPPIDFVIRTKWNNGRVDWNSSDPIL